MIDTTLSKLGGACSLLLGISYLVAAVVYLLLPPDQQDAAGIPPERFLASLAQTSTLSMVFYSILAVSSLVGIAAVLAISQSVRSLNDG
jgi:hypothetical protein